MYAGFDDELDEAGRRKVEQRTDGTALEYDYNTRGELVSALRRRDNGSLRSDWTHAHSYDDSGNRVSRLTPEGRCVKGRRVKGRDAV